MIRIRDQDPAKKIFARLKRFSSALAYAVFTLSLLLLVGVGVWVWERARGAGSGGMLLRRGRAAAPAALPLASLSLGERRATEKSDGGREGDPTVRT